MKDSATPRCDGDTCNSRSSDGRTDTWNDMRAEVKDFFTCTSIYDGVTLLGLDEEVDRCQMKMISSLKTGS